MAERHIFAQKVASWGSPSPKSRAGWRKPRLPSDWTSSGLWVQQEAGLDVKGWAAFEKRPCLNQGSDPLSARLGDIALLVPYCLSPLCLPTSAGHCWDHTDLGLRGECQCFPWDLGWTLGTLRNASWGLHLGTLRTACPALPGTEPAFPWLRADIFFFCHR